MVVWILYIRLVFAALVLVYGRRDGEQVCVWAEENERHASKWAM